MDVTVVVATFGSQEWQNLAESRAVPSAISQAPVIRIHDPRGTLASVRNHGLEKVRTEWVVFLDGDDELAPGYVEALSKGTADLRAPSVSYVRKYHKPRPPGVPKVAGHEHACTGDCITSGAGNWLIIGTAARTHQLREAGGWREWDCYEDFDLWMRVLLAGATVEAIPEARYVAHVRPDSRNRSPEMRSKNRVHHAIVAANLPESVRAA